MVHRQFSGLQNAFLSDAVGNVSAQEVVRHFVKLFNPLDMRAYDGLFFFEDPNVSVDFGIAKLVVIEIAEGSRDLILTLMVKEDMESACVVIDLELGSHGLLDSTQQAADEDDVVNGVAVKLANVVGPWLRIHNHSDRDWGEYF